ncbi:MAG: response regulator [Verrucomicrobia bacterium]|nr:response regulator [Verrucomicrobiota bacterium]
MPNPAPPFSPGPAVDILLVEDSHRDAELAIRALDRLGLSGRLLWAKDGAEVLDLFFGPTAGMPGRLATMPKLILLDLKLPKVDGHEVLCRLKSDPRTKGIPVVVLTSSREEADLWRAYQSGANSYTVKPVDFDQFDDVVRDLGHYWLTLNQSAPARQPQEDDYEKPLDLSG